MLVRLVYASNATGSVTAESVAEIMAFARNRNELRNITGMLVFDHQNFMQVIEVGRDMVNQRYANLIRDTRHTNVVLLSYCEIDSRQFAQWSMGFAANESAHKALLLRHVVTNRFEPHTLTAAGAAAVLSELAGIGSVP